MNINLFLQISGYKNIAQPSKNNNEKSLDVLDDLESKFLESEYKVTKKSEKVSLKFEFTDGISKVYGCEYDNLITLRNKLINQTEENKFPKVLVGKNFEVRRGLIYLTNNNISLL